MAALTDRQAEAVVDDLRDYQINLSVAEVRRIDEAIRHGEPNRWGLEAVAVKSVVEQVLEAEHRRRHNARGDSVDWKMGY